MPSTPRSDRAWRRLATPILAVTATMLATPAVRAVELLPTVPLVESSVTAQTYRTGTVSLNDLGTSLDVFDWNDYRYEVSPVRHASAWLGGPGLAGAVLNQWDGMSTVMSAQARTDFGMNRIAVTMDGNAAPDYYKAYGSLAPTPVYIESYINNFDYGSYQYLYDPNNARYIYADDAFAYHYDRVAPSPGYVDTYTSTFDYGNANPIPDPVNSRTVYAAGAVSYGYDAVTGELLIDDPGLVVPDPNTGAFIFVPNADALAFDQAGQIEPGPWGGVDAYFVPNQPEVEINLQAQRLVQAYSRWEDVFYFDEVGMLGRGAGIATVEIEIEGELVSPNWSGSFSFYARDWEHKDTGTFLTSLTQTATDTVFEFPGRSELTIEIPFVYGQPQYVKAEAFANLYGEGSIDFSHTVRIASIAVPEDTAVYSYANYLFGGAPGYNVLGGVDGGTLPGGVGGFFGGGGGGGGGGGVIPLPAPALLLCSALGALVAAWRRRPGAP